MKKYIKPILVVTCFAYLILPNMPQAQASSNVQDKNVLAFTNNKIINQKIVDNKAEIAKAEIEKGQLAKEEYEKAEAARKEAERIAAEKARAEKEKAEREKAEKEKAEREKAQRLAAEKRRAAESQAKNKANVTQAAPQKASRGDVAVSGNMASVINTAKRYIGVPYSYGGSSPAGFDCSGFVQYVFKQHGVYLPHSSAAMFGVGSSVSSLAPGDLVFFNTNGRGVSHVGIYLGGNRFISSTSNSGVKIDNIRDGYWGPRYLGAKRL